MLRQKTKHCVFYSGTGTFRQVSYGKFTLITDQKHLVKTPEPKRDRAASSWQMTEVNSHVSILLPLHQVAYKHGNADTLSRVPSQADSHRNQISLAGFPLAGKYYYCKRSCSEVEADRVLKGIYLPL